MTLTTTRSPSSAMSSTERLLSLPKPLLAAIRAELGPAFANDQQRVFFDSHAPELLYSGAFGAGKSRILCEKAYALGKRFPGAPIGIFRKVRASLAATTQVTFFRDVLPLGAIVNKNKTEGWYELANGSRFWLLGLDSDPVTGVPSKVGSLDLAFAFVDEAVEVTEADWTMLEGRLRYPGVPWTQIAGATNPADPSHWLRRRFDGREGREYVAASTMENRFLPQGYLDRMAGLTGIYRERYVKGEWIALGGGLFDPAWIRTGPVPMHYEQNVLVPDLRRIVVAVDPAVTSNKDSDETGIIVAGIDAENHAYVLADLSGRYTPEQWAHKAVEGYRTYRADRIVAEVNNGGDMVEATLRAVEANVPYTSVTASRGKLTRAEPVAALYGSGKVTHLGDFHALVSQMIGYDGKGASPDRMDALVWALTELMPGGAWGSGDYGSGVA